MSVSLYFIFLCYHGFGKGYRLYFEFNWNGFYVLQAENILVTTKDLNTRFLEEN